MNKLYKYQDGVIPNTLAFSYAIGGYAVSWVLLLQDILWLMPIAGLLLTHSMVISAYLIHECAHNTLFRVNSLHKPVAELLMCLTGACYGDYNNIRKKHLRHHVDRADVITYDYRRLLRRSRLLRRLVYILEYFYIPAIDILMHAMVLTIPFFTESRREARKRVVLVTVTRLGLLCMLAWYVPLVLMTYVVAYLMFLLVMRFMDTFQHTYPIIEIDDGVVLSREERDSEYENQHTFSNLLSTRLPVLNLLVLNFCYHNVHHVKPVEPWYRLPHLHQQMRLELATRQLPFLQQLRDYHRFRMQRVVNSEDLVTVPVGSQIRYVGANGVSFLTAH